MIDWEPLILTFRLAFITTLLLLVVSIPLAYWLAYSRSRTKPVVETLVSMPLVLPPTVLGFYLLVAFSPSNAFGAWIDKWLGLRLVFSFEGLVLASVIYSLPFMVQPIQSGLSNLSPSLREAAYVLGKSRRTTLWKVLLPNIKPSLLTGVVLSFAHTVGEFGVVLMIGGNMPGRTRVASIAIYDEVESLNYPAANTYWLILLALDVDFEIETGMLITLYGKSGAGKTSILRILAGLLAPDRGRIVVNGHTWLDTERRINLRPQKRKAGFVFQDYALFPNMTVRENLAFALPENGDRSTVQELIGIMELGELQHRRPDTLSGGQKQRVALARALVQRPDILMLDEPLSALDYEMRGKLQSHILQVHREYGLTTILVSHDTSEVFRMSDLVIVVEEGKIIRKGSPSEIFAQREVSGKFQFTGEVVMMEKQDFIYILSILIGKELVRVIATESEAEGLVTGDRVLVASKAFNPVIKKI